IVRIVLTGVAANNIEGGILYLLLKFLFGVGSLNNFRGFKYFIIDEKFMLGMRNMCFIDNCLC
ncbi:hypothetical protein QBC45DRAFT_327665, partial [Copromyces sp. CBS 386.78]